MRFARTYVLAFLSLALAFFTLSLEGPAFAQITNLNDSTATPIPGVGHDYFKLLNETVNPADGSVSLRIGAPTPSGRGLGFPFAFAYDSNGVHFPIPQAPSGTTWFSNYDNFLSQGGWTYSTPVAGKTKYWKYEIYPPGSNTQHQCWFNTDFMFQDAAAGRHMPSQSQFQWLSTNYGCSGTNRYTVSGDDFFAMSLPAVGTLASGPLFVADASGTVFHFPDGCGGGVNLPSSGPSPITRCLALPDYIEDRNGNQIFVTGGSTRGAFSVTDTLGRTVLSSSGFGTTGNTVTVSGLSQPYAVTWGTANSNFSVTTTLIENVGGCGPIVALSGTQPVITAISLPNGQQYQFTYDPTYGELSKITYPSGGYVSYTWGLNSQSALLSWNAPNVHGSGGCVGVYDKPAVLHRYVSFDGATVALQQDFSYSTTGYSTSNWGWTSKQTTVTTHDLIRGVVFQTVYVYSPIGQTPLEQTITYQDFSGATLRTVTKGWYDQYELACELQTLGNGQISGSFFTYGPGGQVTDKKEYDYGLITSTSACPVAWWTSPPPSQPSVTATRETATTYQTFANTPIYPSRPSIFDRPSSIITYGNGTRLAETDDTYDQYAQFPLQAVANLPAGTHDENNYAASSTAARGNPTTITNQCFQGSQTCANAINTMAYDETGQLLSSTDACGNPTCSDMTGTNHMTTFSYVDSYTDTPPSYATNAYITKVAYPPTANGVSHVEKFSYRYSDGRLTQDIDQNQQVTSYTYADSLNRLTEVDFPDGGQTLILYNDTAPSPTTTTSVKLNSLNQYLTVKSVSDGIGHTVQTQLTSDPAGTDLVDTTYDGLGLVWKQSNPHRSSTAPTDGTTTYNYDALGRATQVTRPDGSTALTTYTGRATQVQDEGNGTQRITRISQTDGLGRLASVCEVAPGPFVGAGGASTSSLIGSAGTPAACGQDIVGTGFLSTFQYDALDNLLQATQVGIANRTYTYNSLSELVSVFNPESGTVNYSYDPAGNLSTKTDARGITTTLSYDTLSRILTKTFSDSTPAITNTYDVAVDSLSVQYPVGRLVKSGTSNTATVNSYDKMGRVASQWQCTPQNCGSGYFPLVYNYDLIGDVTSATNGAGITFSYALDSAAQLTAVTSSLSDSNHPGTLLSNAAYNPDGEITSALLGNQITETSSFNSRLFLTSFAAGSVYNFNVASRAPNGSVLSTSDTVNGSWAYGYDQFNRLTNANQNSAQSVYTYVYDRFGNRWQQNGPHAFAATFTGNNPGNPQNNNRMDGYSYDLSGNLLNDGSHSYGYDAENRVTSVDNGSTATYVYDALGRRVRKTTAANGTVDFLYDLNNDEITQLSTTGSWNRVEVQAQGRHIATYTPSTTYFNYADSLGTERLRTNLSGGLYETCTGLPFGDWLSCSASDSSPMHFTGEEHDNESGLDHFDHRKYASMIGMWTSPDLLPGDQSDPQSLNRYVYARNNPVNLIDLLGLQDSFRACVTLDENGNPAPCATSASGADINNLPINSSDLSAAMQLAPQATSSAGDLQTGDLTTLTPTAAGTDSSGPSSGSSTLGAIQTGLDVLGVVPGIGDLANAASGIISLSQGHIAGGLLSLASAVPFLGAPAEAIKIARLGEEGVQGFKTFRAFKKFYGAAQEGMQWHHIVEQGGGRIARFGPEAIHNVENLVQVPTEIHRKISAYYSSVDHTLSESQTVRQWLKSKSFEEQLQFAQEVLRRFK